MMISGSWTSDDQREFLFHAGAQVGNLHFGEFVDAEAPEHPLFAFAHGGLVNAVEAAEEVEQVVWREEVLEFELGGEETNLGTYIFGLFHHAAAVEDGVALVGTDEGAEHAQGSGLAGAVGAQQTEYLAPVGVETQVVHRRLPFGGGPFDSLLFAREREGLAQLFGA